MSKRMAYRPDIDGLRALAVLSVVLFHVGYDVVPGGFVGVDVFFVISGYLITRIIAEEVAGGSFSYSRFYLRRARRLFPALFATLLLTGLAAVWLFSPEHLQRFGGALVHSMASLSNIYFWTESGYFDADATLKPLLHTWSLSVEEQYYLFWPLLLVFLLNKKRNYLVPSVLCVLFLISLYLNYIFQDGVVSGITTEDKLVWDKLGEWFSDGQASIFYLLPFRVFEFAVGATVVWLEVYRLRREWLYEILNLAGLALILYAVFWYDVTLLFPSYYGLIPVIGAGLILYAGMANYSGRLLNNRLMVFTGQISYSIYLVHWPLIVFTIYYQSAGLNELQKFMTVVLSLVMAYLMYRYVEQPFRRSRSVMAAKGVSSTDTGFVLVMLVLVVSLYVPASNIWANSGWEWRQGEFQTSMLKKLRAGGSGRGVAIRSGTCHLNMKGRSFSEHRTFLANCIDSHRNSIVVFGDSHAADIYASLSGYINKHVLADVGLEVIQFTGAGCSLRGGGKRCVELRDYALEWIHERKDSVRLLVYSARGEPLIRNRNAFVRETSMLEKLASSGVPVVYVGPRIEFADPYQVLAKPFIDSTDTFMAAAGATRDERFFRLDEELRSHVGHLASKGYPIRYFSSVEAFCPERKCIMGRGDDYFYVDYGHLSPSGQMHIAEKLEPYLTTVLFGGEKKAM